MTKIIYFTAAFCAPCKQFGPIVERVCKDLGVQLEKIDISTDDGQEIASTEGIRGVPAIIVTRNGFWQTQSQGVVSERALTEMIREFL